MEQLSNFCQFWSFAAHCQCYYKSSVFWPFLSKKATRFPLFLLWKDGGDDETGRGGESGGEGGGDKGGGGEHLLPLRLFPLWLSHSASCLLWRNWKATNTIITTITVTITTTMTNITFPDWATLCALTPTWWLCTGGSDIRCFCRKSSTAGQTQFYPMHDKDENMSIGCGFQRRKTSLTKLLPGLRLIKQNLTWLRCSG